MVSQWCTFDDDTFNILLEIFSGQFKWLKKDSAGALSELSRTKMPGDFIFQTLKPMKDEEKSLLVSVNFL